MSGIQGVKPYIKPDFQKPEVTKPTSEAKEKANNVNEKDPKVSKDEVKGELQKYKKEHSDEVNKFEFNPKKESGKDGGVKGKFEEKDGGPKYDKKSGKDGGVKGKFEENDGEPKYDKKLGKDGGVKGKFEEKDGEPKYDKKSGKDGGIKDKPKFNPNDMCSPPEELKKQILEKPKFNIPFRDTDGDGMTNLKYACVYATRSKIS